MDVCVAQERGTLCIGVAQCIGWPQNTTGFESLKSCNSAIIESCPDARRETAGPASVQLSAK